MTDSIEDFLNTRKPTADRPLMGHTVLLVEDSRFSSEAMRLLCLRSGARIRRADSLRSADRHLRTYRPSVVIVDLGLPDGSGLDLIADLAAATPRVGVILGTSGDNAQSAAAAEAGADGFLAKPVTSLAAFQDAILSRLPEDDRPRGLRAVADETVVPDRIAFNDDLEHVLEVLSDRPDDGALRYASRFLTGVAKTAGDTQLEAAAAGLEPGRAAQARLAELTGLVEDRLRSRAVV